MIENIKFVFSTYFVCIFFSLLGCSKKADKATDTSNRNCLCPMAELPESTVSKQKDSTILERDFYDWSIEGKIGGTIKKIIDAEINTKNRVRNSKYEISTKEVVAEIRNDFPELINKNYQFKLNRIVFCTYHELLCNDTSLPDSIYRELMIKKLSEFKAEIQLLIGNDEKQNSNKFNQYLPPNKIENKKINATIYTENQSGGTNTVNITTSAEFKHLSKDLRISLTNNLLSLKRKYTIGIYPWININIESGSSMRRNLAVELDSLFSFHGNDWVFFSKSNVMIGVHPESPISVFYHPRNEKIAIDLLDVLKLFIKNGFVLKPDSEHNTDTIDIFINGTPNFNTKGQVNVE